MTPPKKKAKGKAKAKPLKKKAFTVTVSGDEVQYFVSVLKKAVLKRLRGKGLESEAGLINLSYTLSGDEETTWISPSGVSAYVNDKEIPVHYKKKNVQPWRVQDFRRKDVVFVENTVDNSTYTAEVFANSVDDIRVEISLSEQWTLPDGREIEIYSLTVFSPSDVDLEYQDGGGGYINGELITADGKSVGLGEEGNEDTGGYRIKISDD